MLADSDVAIARLRARVEMAGAELRTLEATTLQPRARAIVAISKLDIECAATCLRFSPDAVELEHVSQWLDMVESQLRTVRRGLTAIGQPEESRAKRA